MRKRAVSKREARINTFYKFLIEQNAFVEYRENVRKAKWETLNTIFNRLINNWVNSAFSWLHTHEGMDYWCKIAIRWNEYVIKNDIK